MSFIQRRPWFFASALALLGVTACNKPDEVASADEAQPVVAVAAADQALLGHEYLRLTDARPRLLEDVYADGRLEFALDELENYYVGVGPRVLVVERGAAKPYARMIELPGRFSLLGIHDNKLILAGDDPERCGAAKPAGKLYAEPGKPCTSVYSMAFEDQAAPRRIAAFDGSDPVLVGDQVAGFDDEVLVHVPIAGGEAKRTATKAQPASRLAVAGDRLLWSATGAGDHSQVLRSSAPFDEVEVALALEAPLDQAAVTDVAWIGESIAYLVGKPNDKLDVVLELHRKTGEASELLISELPAGCSLVNDRRSAWMISPEQLWRIDATDHRKITTTTTPKLVTGTRSGLAWVEEQDGALSLQLASEGPPGLVAPALAGNIVELPVRPQAEGDQDATPDGFVAPW